MAEKRKERLKKVEPARSRFGSRLRSQTGDAQQMAVPSERPRILPVAMSFGHRFQVVAGGKRAGDAPTSLPGDCGGTDRQAGT